jgi:hypothetical protein
MGGQIIFGNCGKAILITKCRANIPPSLSFPLRETFAILKSWKKNVWIFFESADLSFFLPKNHTDELLSKKK